MWDCSPRIPGGRGGRVTSYNPPRLRETCLNKRAGEIGSFVILAEDLGSIPRNHMVAYNYLLIPVPGSQMLFSAQDTRQASGMQIDKQAKHSYT